MKRQNRRIQLSEKLNIWKGFTDLMSNALIIMFFLFFLAIIPSIYFQQFAQKNQNELQKQTDNLIDKIKKLERNNQQLRKENLELRNTIKDLARKKKGQSPPLFVISDSDVDEKGRSLRFELGSAELPEALSDYIQNKVVREIRNNRDTYKNYIIQVIGHTDAQKVVGTKSNLDVNLEKVANNSNPESMRNLQAGSNADLGLMRALAVVKMLEQNLNLREGEIQAYSAAQLYDADGKYTQSEPGKNKDEPARRRVEIRFTPPAEVKKL